MRIAFKHSAVIPVRTYGGTERVLCWLMKELVDMGHEVFLLGPAGCSVSDLGVRFIEAGSDWEAKLPKGIDIIHFFEPMPEHPTEIPSLVTIHGNGQPGEVFNENAVFLSKKHAENHNAECYVYNGIDLSAYDFNPRSIRGWDTFCFLAKAKWKVKNLKDCVRVCKDTKKDLYVAGGRAWSFSRYIHSLGMVTDPQKLNVLNRSDALLFPVRWHEPFGIAILEAYALGLPVITSAYGSLPELVDRTTGIVCKNYEEFNAAVAKEHNTFDPERIRAYAEKNFSSRIMANSYFKLYKRVIAGEKLNIEEPRSIGAERPETLLPF